MRVAWFVLVPALATMAPGFGVDRLPGRQHPMPTIERKTCKAQDGVSMVYSAAGSGEPALIVIHPNTHARHQRFRLCLPTKKQIRSGLEDLDTLSIRGAC
jgi:hypothetical protein